MKDISKKINLFSLGTYIVLFGIIIIHLFRILFFNLPLFFGKPFLYGFTQLSYPFLFLIAFLSIIIYIKVIVKTTYKNNWILSSTILNTVGLIILVGLFFLFFGGYLKCILFDGDKCSINLWLAFVIPLIISGVFYLIGLVLFIVGYQIGKRRTPSKTSELILKSKQPKEDDKVQKMEKEIELLNLKVEELQERNKKKVSEKK